MGTDSDRETRAGSISLAWKTLGLDARKASTVRVAGILAIAFLLVSAGCASNISSTPTSPGTTTGAMSSATNSTASGAPQVTPQLTEEAIVQHVTDGYRSLQSYHGTFETTTVRNGTTTCSVRMEIWSRPHHDDLRIETIQPNASAGNVFVTNGSVTWSYVASENAATKRSVRNSSGSATQTRVAFWSLAGARVACAVGLFGLGFGRAGRWLATTVVRRWTGTEVS
ncbi:MAG: outer membrane lipoprotein carrier protein LolA [Haloplanus sp.]